MSLLEEYLQRLAEPSDITAHMPFLYETVLSYPQGAVIELGVRSGNSTSALLAAAETVGAQVWSADIAKPDVPARWHWCVNPRWRFRCGDDLSEDILSWLPPACDVLFLDTSHDYEHTVAELRAYVPRVRPGGVALFHDTELEEPPPKEVGFRPQPPYPVALALDGYCRETGLTWENRPGCYGLGILRIPAATSKEG